MQKDRLVELNDCYSCVIDISRAVVIALYTQPTAAITIEVTLDSGVVAIMKYNDVAMALEDRQKLGKALRDYNKDNK